jgi:hypothetical protein
MRKTSGKATWAAMAGAGLLMACDGDSASASAADTTGDDAAEVAGPDAGEGDAAGGDADEPSPEPLACALPQAPRDLSLAGGVHEATIPGPGDEAQWLCNVHFHDPLEHAGVGLCPEVTAGGDDVCVPAEAGGEDEPVRAGDIIEVHWVYSSCQPAGTPPPEAGQGLAPCVCDGGQILRVRAQVYVVDSGDADASSLLAPPDGVALASYAGSTTGSKYDGVCSEVAVNWEVGTECHSLSRPALGAWCEDNVFGEGTAHGPRELITEPSLLSPFDPTTPD